MDWPARTLVPISWAVIAGTVQECLVCDLRNTIRDAHAGDAISIRERMRADGRYTQVANNAGNDYNASQSGVVGDRNACPVRVNDEAKLAIQRLWRDKGH